MPAVTVNLNVNVDANGEIQVFGAEPDTAGLNIVVATGHELPVNALYDSTKNGPMGAGLIEFWEPASDMGNTYAKLATTSAFNINGEASYKQTAKVLACGLERVLVDTLDAKDASPFNSSKYDGPNASNYRECSDFGRLALSAYSHYLFGHVDATAAITNDESFMSSMLSLTDGTPSVKEGGLAANRYSAWIKKTYVDGNDVDIWSEENNSSDANLAIRLVKAILSKSTVAPISATQNTPHRQANNLTVKYGPDTLANIVKQVIGQDATRAMDQDNNELAPEVHQILRFEEGDTIYISIELDTPSVTVSPAGQSNAGKPSTSKYDKDLNTSGIQKERYDIKITLGPRNTEYDPTVLTVASSYNDVVSSVETFVDAAQNTTIDIETPLSLSSFGIDMTLAPTDADKKRIRDDVITSMFTVRPDIDIFRVTRSDIGLTSSQTANDEIVIVKPVASLTAAPIVVDPVINSTTSIYASLTNIGDINRFSITSKVFTIMKTGTGTYSFTNNEATTTFHNEGDIITYEGVTIEFGSAIISGASGVVPPSAPLAPSALSATAGDGQASISFTAGANGGSAITNYKYSVDGGVTFVAFSPAVTSSPVVISGLTNGTAYQISLKAVNSVGDGAASSSVSVTPVSANTAPLVPTGLSATAGDGQVSVSFTTGANGGSAITNYKYSVDNGITFVAFSPAKTSSPVVISGLTNGTVYQIKLKAVNAVGDGVASASVSATPVGAPLAPSALSATAGDGQVSVSFTAGSNNGSAITNYKYSVDNGVTFTAFSTPVTSSPVVITGLTNGTAYQIKLKAVNAVGDGVASGSVSATPAGLPFAPILIDDPMVGDGQAFIYLIPGSNNGSAITNYKYSVDDGVTYTAFSTPVTGTLAIISGLTNGTTYQIKLKAVNAVGDGAESNSVSATPAGLPFAPTSLSAVPGDGQATVSFTDGSDNGSAITNYKYSIDSGLTYTEFATPVTSSPVVITGLTNGTAYSIKLKAVNSVGDGIGSASVPVTPAGLPFAPSALSATGGNGQATVSFTEGGDNGSSITNYKYSVDDGVTYTAFATPITSSPVVINGLTKGASYVIKLRAINSVGDGAESSSVSVTLPNVPSAPNALTATPGDGQATLDFISGDDNGSVTVNYKYSIDGGLTYTAFNPVVLESPVVITGLTNGTSYSIKLREVNSIGDGLESATVSVTPAGLPFAPTALSAEPGSGKATISFTAGSDNGSTITNYKYSIDGGSTYTAFSTPVTSSPVVVTGLTNGTAYEIKLLAVNSVGDGVASASVSVTPAGTPFAPTGLAATPGDGQATVTFTEGGNNGAEITNYKYSTDDGVTYTAFSPVDTTSPVVITGLTNGTAYTIKLRAINSAGDGVESGSVPVTPAGAPLTPSALSATAGDGQVSVSFTAGSNNGSAITNYKYSIDNGVTYTAFSPAVTSSPAIITGLTNGTVYQIRLRAVNSVGDGVASASVSATPVGAPLAPSALSATAGDGQVSVSFTAGLSNGSAITNYKYSIDNGVTYTAFSPAVTSSPVVITGLTNGTAYQIKLQAVNSVGDGIASASVSATPVGAPLAPSALSATAGDGQVSVSFTAGSNGGITITNYKYSIDNGVTYTAFSPAVTSSPAVITGLTNGTSYQIRLRAVNAIGDGVASASVSATPVAPTAKGIVDWATILDGSSNDFGYSVARDSSNNIYLSGVYASSTSVTLRNKDGTSSGITLPSTSSFSAAFIAKYNSSGTVQWATCVALTNSNINAYSIAIDSGNNICITGDYSASSAITLKNASGNTQSDSSITLPITTLTAGFIIQYNSSGIVQWATNIDGTNNEYGYSVAIDSGNNIYISGTYMPSITVTLKHSNGSSSGITLPTLGATPGGTLGFIVKYNSSGTVQWATILGDYTHVGERPYIVADSLNNIYIALNINLSSTYTLKNATGNGQTSSPITLSAGGSTTNVALLKYNSSGAALWATCISRGTSGLPLVKALRIDSANNVYICGNYTHDITIRNASGYGQTNSSIYLNFASSVTSMYLIKYNSSGVAQWATNLTGTANIDGLGLATDAVNNVYVTGTRNGVASASTNIIQNASGNTQTDSSITLPTTTSLSMYLIKYDLSGIAQWATYLNGTNADMGYAITIDTSNNVYVSGRYSSSTITTLPSANTTGGQTNSTITLPIAATPAAFLVKYI